MSNIERGNTLAMRSVPERVLLAVAPKRGIVRKPGGSTKFIF